MSAWPLLSQPAPDPSPVPVVPDQDPLPPAPTSIYVDPQLTLPPDIVERLLSPTTHWWAQPGATLIAALIAIGAAVLAWKSVTRQIVKQQDLHDASADEDRRQQFRNDGMAALSEAVGALQKARIALHYRAFRRRARSMV